jgi:ABC-2 type transport system ATP-binding protein
VDELRACARHRGAGRRAGTESGTNDGAALISFVGVSKRYRSLLGKEVSALEDFSLELRRGEVVGLAGPNGAGKSTLISLLLGFLAPTSGTIRIDGLEPRRFIERRGMGYLSELVNIPSAWRVAEALRRYGLLAGIAPSALTARVDRAMSAMGLDEHRDKRVRQLSKGNLQRLGLAQALLSEEEIVVLDEPTHGLDPVWTQRFRDVVEALRQPGRIILIASHNLDELARLADRVAIVDHGRLQRVVDVRASEREVTEGAPYRLLLASGEERVALVFPHAARIGPGEFELRGMSLEAINAGVASLIGAGVLVNALHPLRSALEQQFRDAVSAPAPSAEGA